MPYISGVCPQVLGMRSIRWCATISNMYNWDAPSLGTFALYQGAQRV
jgi:hypothetical protein